MMLLTVDEMKMKLILGVREAKRLMGLKVHQGGFKLASSLIKSGGGLCERETALDLIM